MRYLLKISVESCIKNTARSVYNIVCEFGIVLWIILFKELFESFEIGSGEKQLLDTNTTWCVAQVKLG